MNRHLENCPAPICCCDSNPDYKKVVVWYPSEPVCRYENEEIFPKIQARINELVRRGKWKNTVGFTAAELEKIKLPKMKVSGARKPL